MNEKLKEAARIGSEFAQRRGFISPHFTWNIALFQQVNEFKEILVKLFDLIDPADILTLYFLA